MLPVSNVRLIKKAAALTINPLDLGMIVPPLIIAIFPTVFKLLIFLLYVRKHFHDIKACLYV